MLACYVDFNRRERNPDGSQAVAIVIGRANPTALGEKLTTGMRVIVYDEEMQCIGIVRPGRWRPGWVADLALETIVDISKSQFERLCVLTKRAALKVTTRTQS